MAIHHIGGVTPAAKTNQGIRIEYMKIMNNFIQGRKRNNKVWKPWKNNKFYRDLH